MRGQRSIAGVGNCEATRTVGALGHAVLETGLPDQRGLLVAGDTAYRNNAFNGAVGRTAEVRRAVTHVGQH